MVMNHEINKTQRTHRETYTHIPTWCSLVKKGSIFENGNSRKKWKKKKFIVPLQKDITALTQSDPHTWINQAPVPKQHETKGTARRNGVGGKDSNTQVCVLQGSMCSWMTRPHLSADYNEHTSVTSSETNSLYPRCPCTRASWNDVKNSSY